MTDDRRLYSAQAAAMIGVTHATWRRYCSTAGDRPRHAPPADGTDITAGHARPWWWASTIRQWQAQRPRLGRDQPGD